MTSPTLVSIPEWTEVHKKRGLDPLGMQNSSVILYQSLLPGISNVTIRVRYFGLYSWLSLVYAQKSGDTNPVSWQRYVRRAEALYALIAQRKGNETGVAGTDWASRRLEDETETVIDFVADAEPGSPTHYLKQAWGAYGAAYKSQMDVLGLYTTGANHEIPVPTEKLGRPLGEAFAESGGAVMERFVAAIEQGRVSLVDLDAFTALTPGAIPSDSRERQLYEKLLFAEAGLERIEDTSRRSTLDLLLNFADQTQRTPTPDEFRWAMYAGHLPDGATLNCAADDLLAQQRLWSIYQANDLIHICFEALLKYFLDELEPFRDGLSLEAMIPELVGELERANSGNPKTWREFLETTQPRENALYPDDPNSDFSLTKSVMNACRHDSVCSAEGAHSALKLLATLQNRLESVMPGIEAAFSPMDRDAFRSTLTELRFLQTLSDKSFKEVVGCLIEERVIRRHMWVALRKLRYQGDYTFLFDSDNGKLRLRQKDGPVFTNPRLGPAIRFLQDIHLLNQNGLTEYGRERLGAR